MAEEFCIDNPVYLYALVLSLLILVVGADPSIAHLFTPFTMFSG